MLNATARRFVEGDGNVDLRGISLNHIAVRQVLSVALLHYGNDNNDGIAFGSDLRPVLSNLL